MKNVKPMETLGNQMLDHLLSVREQRADLPDRTIEGRNTKDIPLWTNPAPQCCIPVHLAPGRCRDEAEHQSDDECQAIAAEEVVLLHCPQLLGIVLALKD